MRITPAVRHTVKKTFDSESILTTTVVYYGVPIVVKVEGRVGDKPNFESLQILGVEQKTLEGFDTPQIDHDSYVETVKQMFPHTNPETGKQDITGEEFYVDSIAETIQYGAIVPQRTETGENIFNGGGSITISEVLKAIGVIEQTEDTEGVKSLDNISQPEDFFNRGYNICCWGYASPFYNLYTREELKRPITRIELAYLLVVCTQKFNLFNLPEGMGISFNWLHPFNYISSFDDYETMQVGIVMDEEGYPIIDLHKYLDGRTVTELIEDIKTGKSAIPLPMIMALVELGVEGYFYFEYKNLAPLKQVSRGELCYLFTKLRESFE